MPLAILSYHPEMVHAEHVRRLSSLLPSMVAEALDVPENPEARLTASDVEVWARERMRFDKSAKALEIVVLANDYPERRKDLDERSKELGRKVKFFLDAFPEHIHGFVWVLLAPGGFAEF